MGGGEGGKQQAVCSPSRTSFLTGRRPDSTRIFDLVNYFRHLGGNYTTLPQHFKNHGYVTQSVGKVFHGGSASGFTDDYPYSWTYPAFHAPTKKYSLQKICPRADGHLYRDAVCPVDLGTVPGGSLPDIQNTDHAIGFLNNRSRDLSPFFLAVGFHRPHLPFAYPKEYLELYPLQKIGVAEDPFMPAWLPSVAWTPFDELRLYQDIKEFNVSYPYGSLPLLYQRKLRQSYSAATSYVDAQLGRLLHSLDHLGLADNTIITLHGDHGWQLGEHGEWCKHTNFDIATRIPMLVYVPGVTSKETSPGQIFPFQDALGFKGRRNQEENGSLKFVPEKRQQQQQQQQHEKHQEQQKTENAAADDDDHDNDDDDRDRDHGHDVDNDDDDDGNTPLVTDAFVEAVDLYATISELAGLEVPPLCPEQPFHVEFCTEGVSLVPLINHLTSAITGRESQFPGTNSSSNMSNSSNSNMSNKFRSSRSRSGRIKSSRSRSEVAEREEEGIERGMEVVWKRAVFNQYPRPSLTPGPHTMNPQLPYIQIMGYSMRTRHHRYTEWLVYNHTTFTAHWDRVLARELYDYGLDPLEDVNVAWVPAYASLLSQLSRQLRDGWRKALPSARPLSQSSMYD